MLWIVHQSIGMNFRMEFIARDFVKFHKVFAILLVFERGLIFTVTNGNMIEISDNEMQRGRTMPNPLLFNNICKKYKSIARVLKNIKSGSRVPLILETIRCNFRNLQLIELIVNQMRYTLFLAPMINI